MRLIDADELKKCAIPCELHNGALTDLCVPLYQIDNAPTADEYTKPKGKWELHGKRYYCSECGEEAIDLESEPDVYSSSYCLTDYCPYCGTDMRGEENGS